jgi:hypothetical protein
VSSTAVKSGVSLKSVALPAEHGGWAFLVEPMLLGLLLAPSWAGLCLCFAAASAFLLHQPLKVIVSDRRKGRVYARTRLAQRFALGYAGLGAVTFALAILTARGPFWLPLLASLPFAALQLAAELRGRGRGLTAETAGAVALAGTAPAILLADNAPTALALAAWLLLVLRSVSSIVYVRARLRQVHGKPAPTGAVIAVHIACMLVSALLWAGGLANVLAPLGVSLLMLRAGYGLTFSHETRAKVIGMQELVVGLVYVGMCVMAAVGQ